jgi:hypothetical protein
VCVKLLSWPAGDARVPGLDAVRVLMANTDFRNAAFAQDGTQNRPPYHPTRSRTHTHTHIHTYTRTYTHAHTHTRARARACTHTQVPHSHFQNSRRTCCTQQDSLATVGRLSREHARCLLCARWPTRLGGTLECTIAYRSSYHFSKDSTSVR